MQKYITDTTMQPTFPCYFETTFTDRVHICWFSSPNRMQRIDRRNDGRTAIDDYAEDVILNLKICVLDCFEKGNTRQIEQNDYLTAITRFHQETYERILQGENIATQLEFAPDPEAPELVDQPADDECGGMVDEYEQRFHYRDTEPVETHADRTPILMIAEAQKNVLVMLFNVLTPTDVPTFPATNRRITTYENRRHQIMGGRI